MRLGIRPKVILGVLAPLALVFGGFAFIEYRLHEREMYEIAGHSAVELGALVESGLVGAMMTADRPAIQSTVDHLADNTRIGGLLIIDSAGVVRVAPGKRDVGRALPLTDPGCNVCHGTDAEAARPTSVVTILPGTGRVLRNCRPIANRTECHGCHDPAQQYNGVLITDLALDTIDTHLSDYVRFSLASLLGAIALGGLALGLVMDRIVVGPLGRLTYAVRATAGGDLTRRAKVDTGDELGELAQAVNRTADMMADRVHLEQELRRSSDELVQVNAALQEKEAARNQLIKQIINAQEAERRRVARQLHDELAQSLTALVMSLDAAQGLLDDRIPGAGAQLARTRDIVGTALDQTRRMILDLRPSMLDDLGLVSAIRWYADQHLGRTGAVVVVTTAGTQRRLRPEVETTLFRIAQEAMNNVARHADAKQVAVRLTWEPEAVVLDVQDDGRGFDPESVARGHDTGVGMGLLGMRERADIVGGALTIDSAPGSGTRITLHLPTPVDEADA
jgi:signal transduction histidine kinase